MVEILSPASEKIQERKESSEEFILRKARESLDYAMVSKENKDQKDAYAKKEREAKDKEARAREEIIELFETTGANSPVKSEDLTVSLSSMDDAVELVDGIDDVGSQFVVEETVVKKSLDKNKVLAYYAKYGKSPKGVKILTNRKRLTIRQK